MLKTSINIDKPNKIKKATRFEKPNGSSSMSIINQNFGAVALPFLPDEIRPFLHL